MSTTYGLYNTTEKKWIDLGKKVNLPNGVFQASSSDIIKFLADSIDCDIKIIGDDRNTPDEYEDYSEVKQVNF